MSAPPNVSPAAAPPLPPLPDLNGIGRTDLRARSAYAEAAGIFRIIPGAVSVPSTTGALRELVLWAAHRRVPLIPRGAGSGMPGGNVGSGVLVDLTALDGCPLEIHPGVRRAYAGAGVTLRDLTEKAEEHGLRLPPDPSSARFATLGGIVSTNAAGPRSVRSGSVRHWVEALELITADGESLTLRRGAAPLHCAAIGRFTRDAEPALQAARENILGRFPKTRKNSSGYALDAWLASGDLLDLIIGAEGTLAFVTGIEWRLVPIPSKYAGIRSALRTPEALGDLVPALKALDPSAVEFLDVSFLRFVDQPDGAGAGLLMVEFEGDEDDALAEKLREARRILADHADNLLEATDRRTLEQLWAIRHAASPLLAQLGESRRSMQVIEDGCVPVEALARYIRAVREAGERHGIELVIFGHVGDGNLHVNLLPDVTAPGWERRLAGIFSEVTETVGELGGTLSGEHGDGRLRARALETVYGPEITSFFRLVKEAFDPVGILNPGVKIPTAEDRPFGALKVGAGAATIPEDIEEGLRDIERFARYSVSRLDLADQPDDGRGATGAGAAPIVPTT
jgi:FAD/FMN-containing dehydrogenase